MSAHDSRRGYHQLQREGFRRQASARRARKSRNIAHLASGSGSGRSLWPEAGESYNYDGNRPMSDLFVNILNAFDVEKESFGEESTGAITDL